MSELTMIPSVEARITTWLAVRERLNREPAPVARPTVTLSRQYGCEAFPLAEKLKGLFEQAAGEPWNIYDRMLLEKVARDEELSPALLRSMGSSSRFLDFFQTNFSHYSHDALFEVVARHLLQVAHLGNAIIVGRGGAVVCKQLPNCFHFRLEGSLAYRVASVERRLGLTHAEAETNVRQHQAERERFVSHCLGVDISDRTQFDALFSGDRHHVDNVAAAIFGYVRSAWPEPSLLSPERRAR